MCEFILTHYSLQMNYLVTPASHKLPAVSKILSSLDPIPNKTIIYFSTCAAIEYFQHVFPSILPARNRETFKLVSLHGKYPAKVRLKNFTAFSDSVTPAVLITTDVAARGLDIPNVDLVLQIDPPSDPKVFIHRCGRSGRAGKKGRSIIFLQPGHEEDYIPFLEVRKTPVLPLNIPTMTVTEEDGQAATTAIRKVLLGDRAIHDKAQRGFVSWLKSYSKHQASSIFRVIDLDWADVGRAWGLLRLPKMPETKRWDGDKSLGVLIDWDTYGYKDKKREEARRQAMVKEKETFTETNVKSEQENKEPTVAFSKKRAAPKEREVRRNKRAKKREHETWEQMTPSEREKKLELGRMIEMIKAQNLEAKRNEEFEGFDD